MFISIESNEPSLKNFVEHAIEQLSANKIVDQLIHRSLLINILSYEKKISIEASNGLKMHDLKKPFHYSELIDIIFYLQQNYFEKLKKIDYFPATGLIKHNENSVWLSETQNLILSNLVCFKNGVVKKTLYKNIWPRDKQMHENKLDTHLTNLRNYVFEFSNYNLNFKTSKGLIKLNIN